SDLAGGVGAVSTLVRDSGIGLPESAGACVWYCACANGQSVAATDRMIASLFTMILLQTARTSMKICGRQYCAQVHVSQSGIVCKSALRGCTSFCIQLSCGSQLVFLDCQGKQLVALASTDQIFDGFDTLDATARADSLAIHRRCGTSKVELPREGPALQ